MSVKVMGRVWDADLKPNLKMVLLAYADAAEHDGTEIWPGWERIATMTGYSRPTVARITSQLLESGVLVQVALGHTGRRATYLIDLGHPVLRVSHLDTQSERESVSSERESVSDDEKSVSPVIPLPSSTAVLSFRPTSSKPRNVGWDFYTDPLGFNLPTGTATQQKRVGRLAREVNATIDHFHTEGTDQLTIDDLNGAALAWPKHFQDATLTPEAYAKHLPALLAAPLRGTRHAVKQATRAADDEVIAARLAEVVP